MPDTHDCTITKIPPFAERAYAHDRAPAHACWARTDWEIAGSLRDLTRVEAHERIWAELNRQTLLDREQRQVCHSRCAFWTSLSCLH